MLNERAFKLKEELDIKLNKIKIGRKIPDNTEKYFEFGNEDMEITSPQLFRVMIKWIEEMEHLLIKPSDMISGRTSIKFIRNQYGGSVECDEIQSRRFEDMKIEII